jgi:hypothetical protein
MNSTKLSGEKEMKMINFKTNVPSFDEENIALVKASEILEQIGNDPNPTANQFYALLADSDIPVDEHEDIILAAISIETMMQIELPDDEFFEPTVH